MGRIQPHITIEFFVRRTSVLESTKAGIRKIEDDKEDYCNRRLYIKFINELGIVEAGADAGGLTREFFPLVFREIYALGHLFEQVGEKAKYIHIKPLEEDKVTKDLLEEYRFVGKMIGLAILNKNPLPEPSISSALFSLLLEFPETWRLLKEIDLSMFEMWDREYINKTKADYEATKVSYEDFGLEDKHAGLVPYNLREQAITEVVAKKLFDNRRKQALAMKEGLETIIAPKYLKMLLPSDLQDLLASEEDVDVDDWRKNTEYSGIYKTHREENGGQDHPTVELFWKLMREDRDLAMKTIKFSTGYDRLPRGGFGGNYINRKYAIEPIPGINNLPKTASCYFTMKFPPYEDIESFRKKLRYAVEESGGFNEI